MATLNGNGVLSPLAILATSLHAQPGMYAVLLGSGVSTGAGIPTGWGIIKELVGRVAAASNPADPTAADAAREDPEKWWKDHGEGELGYATLLEQLAPTSAARQGLLQEFFEPSSDEKDQGLKQPSPAHRAVAQLVKDGYVRVVVTTNFDRLTETALQEIGISPRVIAHPDAVKGMAPLAHSQATVIKLHGDYLDLGSRNTPEELEDYPEEWTRLLDQVFDEYGLVISGWSADWDTALVSCLEKAPNRRYPLYWDNRSNRGDNARRLLEARSGTIIPANDANSLFGELYENVQALERLAHPPLSTAMAVARLKRYLPDPVHRIDLYDLVMQATDDVIQKIEDQPTSGDVSFELLQKVYEDHFRAMDQLAALLITGIWHDDQGEHDQLWIDVLQRLVTAGTTSLERYQEVLAGSRLVPAFIALAAVGVTTGLRGRDGLFIRAATEVEGSDQPRSLEPLPASQLLHYSSFTNERLIKGFPRWDGAQYIYPVSRLFKEVMEDYFADVVPLKESFTSVYHEFEYRFGLLQELTRPGDSTWVRALTGEYLFDISRTQEGVRQGEVDFRRRLTRHSPDVWEKLLPEETSLDQALVKHRDEVLVHYQRWR
ncbi:SIR2 family protein [Corynebacterium testudinoris]|uniref:SIR2-like domain n=1 Tax=Corynebacterium testudinoris TaxID=136857 RepID=A0A0G3H5X7_9CORY|nr:SIR2 family protein [Corynebacterium testudinoris]AKK08801.1 SIR2-like domain [Corynebacterium testudinoris]